MRFSICFILMMMLVAASHAQGNKLQYLENQYATTRSTNQSSKTQVTQTPTRPPSIRNRGDLISPSVAPTPKPPTAGTMNNSKNPTASLTSRQPTTNTASAANGNVASSQPTNSKNPTASLTSRQPTKNNTDSASNGNVASSQPTPKPSKAPTREPTNAPTPALSQSPSTPAPSGTPSASLIPTVQPSGTPSASFIPTASPTAPPSRQPSLEPSDSPSQKPSIQPTESSIPSAFPTVSTVPSSTPSRSPSSIPSERPSRQPSSLPTVSSVPSPSPTNSMLPSLMPSPAPSSVPSTQPSEVASEEPSSVPSEIPSTSPSNIPSTVPSDVPSSQPSAVPSSSSEPSSVPSHSTSPSESGYEALEADVAVPVRSIALMDDPTKAVFETTTLNFLNDYFPADGVTILSVKVTNQKFEQRRALLSNNVRNLQVTDLKVNILVRATRFVGHSNGPYQFEKNIEKTFEKYYEVYASKLVDASSFFRVGFRVETTNDVDSTQRGSALTGSTLIIVCAVAGCALLALFTAAFVWRIHSRRSAVDRGQSLGLPASWSQEISASSGYLESPTESDIYTRQQSRQSLFSERGSQGSNSQRSMVSERSDSPTVGSPYHVDDRSIDTNITNSDRYQQGPNPYSPFASLAPIDENSKMTDIALSTPRNGRTPRGSEFFEVQKFSGAPSTPCGEHATPKHAKFEDCDVRSPKVAFVKSANTPKGTEFVQLNTSSAERTGNIIDDLTRFERAWDVQLDSKVNSVTETPKANNLERYKKAPRRVLYGGSPDKGIYGKR